MVNVNEYSMDTPKNSTQQEPLPPTSLGGEAFPLNLNIKQEPESSDYEKVRTALSASVNIARVGKSTAAAEDDEFDCLPVHFMSTDDTAPSENCETSEQALSGISESSERESLKNNGGLEKDSSECTETSEQPSSESKETSEQVSSRNCEASRQTSLPQDSSNLFQCGVCPEKYSDSSELAQHIRARHIVSERSVRCGECLKVFKFVSHLREHSVVHTGEKPFQCDECSSRFGQASNLRAHVKAMHRTERPYKCGVCPAAFPSQTSLASHVKMHTQGKPYQCDKCPSAFPNPKYLHKHKKNTHLNNHFYKSDMCITNLRSAENNSQVNSDTDERPYQCDQCAISFKRPAHLTVHKRSHTRVKPTTECEICQKVFSTPQSLEKHKKLHLTDKIEKVYRCDQPDCVQHFKHVTGLNQHKVIAHGFAFINGAYRKAPINSISK